jgi:hypothetical protein
MLRSPLNTTDRFWCPFRSSHHSVVFRKRFIQIISNLWFFESIFLRWFSREAILARGPIILRVIVFEPCLINSYNSIQHSMVTVVSFKVFSTNIRAWIFLSGCQLMWYPSGGNFLGSDFFQKLFCGPITDT